VGGEGKKEDSRHLSARPSVRDCFIIVKGTQLEGSVASRMYGLGLLRILKIMINTKNYRHYRPLLYWPCWH